MTDRIERVLGAGGMATVYPAQVPTTERTAYSIRVVLNGFLAGGAPQ